METSQITKKLTGSRETLPSESVTPCFCVPHCTLDGEAGRLAARDSDILVFGEPGVGKRFFARYIHGRRYQDHPGAFVEVTPEMSDDELKVILFEEDRKRVEGMLGRRAPTLTEHSTLFIHHLHSLSPINQSRIARYLIQNELAGSGQKPMHSIIISIRHPWSTLVEQKMVVEPLDRYVQRFDMFAIPPLRERPECIPTLVKSFLAELGRPELSTDSTVLERLKKHYWRDNVRELRLLIEETAVRAEAGMLTFPERFYDEVDLVESLSRMIQEGKRVSVEQALDSLEKTFIRRTLMQCSYDLAATARRLELTEKNLMYRIRKYDVYVPKSSRRR